MKTTRQPLASAPRPRAPHLSIIQPQPDRQPMPTSEELNMLVRAVADTGDRRAFAALFKHFAPRVKAYLMRGGSNEDAAEELVQEAMLSVWRKAATFDAAHAGAATWIFTIARNLRVDHFRRLGHTLVEGSGAEDAELLDEALPHDEQLHATRREHKVRAALTQLPAEQAQVLHLSFYEEHAHAEIARVMGIPLGTVKSRVRLAVKHLRRLLDGNQP